jgi:hypothetical protein
MARVQGEVLQLLSVFKPQGTPGLPGTARFYPIRVDEAAAPKQQQVELAAEPTPGGLRHSPGLH